MIILTKHIKYHFLALGAILIFNSQLLAQDIHFSQFFNAPIITSPSSAGMIDETFRFSANQRVQWRSITDNPFNTFGLSAEVNAPFETDNLGLGFSFVHDIAGDSKFRTVDVNVSGAYRVPISKDSIHAISFGIQTGITLKSISYSDLTFNEQYNGLTYNPNLSNQESFTDNSQSHLNLAMGMSYFLDLKDKIWGEAHLALFNITKPKQSFFANQDILRDRRFLMQLKGGYPINLKWDALPTISLMFQGVYTEFIAGSNVKYTLINERDTYRALYGGLFYRGSDAGYLFAGLDYDSWHIGLSYDINISRLTPASNARGGWEAAVIYKLRYYKYVPKQHRICPNYMK